VKAKPPLPQISGQFGSFVSNMIRSLINALHKLESGLLALILFLLIVLAAYQVAARNFFDSGLLWGDGFVRVAVLWVTLIGAMVASRTDDHIRMDVVSRYLPDGMRHLAQRLTALFTSIVCGLFTWHSLSFIRFEYEDGTLAFGVVPAWVCELIMPVGFAIMGLRYVLHMVFPQPPQTPDLGLEESAHRETQTASVPESVASGSGSKP
jgi:TRAP-type C4-dicarboxylate transport system permease small subunit